MQPRVAHRSREHSYLVASRDECCDNDDRFVATYRPHALGNICLYGSVLAAAVSLVVRECAVASSRFVTGAMTMMTRHPRALRSHIGILYDTGAFWQPWCCSWFERAQLAWSRFATGTVTMTTRHSTTSALIYWGTCSSHRRI